LHAAIDVYADHSNLFTAIRSSRFASAALTAKDVRFNGAAIPRAESSRVLRYFYDFPGKFMSEDARVCIDWMPSGESVEIATTNPDSMNSNQGLSTGENWARDVDIHQLARSIQQDSSHE
jgi:hypothetical protein